MSITLKDRISQSQLAVVTMGMLILLVIISVFAFILIPDNSIDANRQIPQLALSAPGSSYNVLVINSNTAAEKNQGFYLWNGIRDQSDYIPYDTLVIGVDDIVTQYEGVSRTSPKKNYHQENITYYLGADKFGRDVLSRIILGLRISLAIGFLAVLVSLFIGITIGCIGGYYGGRIDNLIMLIINTSWSIPTLLLAFAIILAFGKGFSVIFLAVGLTMWVDVARLVRGQVMQEKSMNYVKASKVLGIDDFTTIFRHILPNIMGPILVMAAANFATAILVEAGLSYLGFGIQPPTPSLGNMLKENYAYATGGFVYLAFFPILAIMVLVLCFNLLGTALRDVFDIKSNV